MLGSATGCRPEPRPALTDGVNRYETIWRIVRPFSERSIVLVAVFPFLLVRNGRRVAFVSLGTERTDPPSFGMYRLIQEFTTQWGTIMAAVTLSAHPALAFLILSRRRLARGVNAGAMQG